MPTRDDASAKETSARRPLFGAYRAIGLAGVGLVLFLIIGVAIVYRFIGTEAARDLTAWQVRLGLLADGRAAALSDWVERQFTELNGLAENASLQIYMTELGLASGDTTQVTDEPAQAAYLRNLLMVTAQHAGFTAPPPPNAGVNANVRKTGLAGLALIDMKQKIVVATPDMPPLDGELAKLVATAPPAGRAMRDIFAAADGSPSMAFVAPIFAVQGEGDASQQIGVVVGVKPIAGELYPLLKPPGPGEPGAESLIVRREGATIDYLSPLADGTAPLQRRLALDTPELDAAFAAANPGGFAIRRDYRGQQVLVTGRVVPPTPWVLVQTIDRETALGESDRRLSRLAIFAFLGLAAIAASLVAAWRHSTSQKTARMAGELAILARRFESQGTLLRLVTDSQPNAIFIADAEGRYRFANREAASRAGIPEADLLGKPLEAVLGPAAAERYLALDRRALESNAPVHAVDEIERGGISVVLQSAHIPLAEMPDLPRSVLVVEQDVTALTREREKRERIMQQLVRTLTGAVDQRDHFAADQSARVAALARAIGQEMGLEPVLVETAEIAGNLMNFGKLLVPPEFLTKTGRLSEDEIKQIRDSMQRTADLIAGIEFNGPVVETLRQVHERWDGSGPRGLKGEEILITARIVAAANAFVAMASPRAYRAQNNVDTALDQLFKQIGIGFDRRVVSALANNLENKGGRARFLERSGGTPGQAAAV